PAEYYAELAKDSPFAKPQPKKPVYEPPPPPAEKPKDPVVVVKQPPPPPPPPREPDPAAKFTYFGSFVQYDERPQVRLYDRRDGRLTVLHEGERFEIGTIQGEVAEIGHDQLVIRNADGTFRLPLGE